MAKKRPPKGSYIVQDKEKGKVYRVLPHIDEDGVEDGEIARIDITNGEPEDWNAAIEAARNGIPDPGHVSPAPSVDPSYSIFQEPTPVVHKAKAPTAMEKVVMANSLSNVALSTNVKDAITSAGGQHGEAMYQIFVETIQKELEKLMGGVFNDAVAVNELSVAASRTQAIVNDLEKLVRLMQNGDVIQCLNVILKKMGG